MPDFHIVTVATKPGGYLKWLKQSCKRNGTDLIILGMDQEWKGYISKYILIKEYLYNIPEDDIICFVDAYDVLMIQHIDILKDKFIKHTENTDYKLICALDPQKNKIFKWYYGSDETEDTIINSGTYIGFVGFIKTMYKDMIEMYNLNNLLSDDQILLNKFYKNNKNEILIDKNKKFFLCECFQNIIHVKKANDDFVFLHRYGNNEMISALIQYGYNFDLNEIITVGKNEIQNFSKKVQGHLFHTLKRSKENM